MEKKTIEIKHLKSKEEYIKELKEIHNELGVSIATDTLIKSDMELLTRADELLVLLTFMGGLNDLKGDSNENI